MSKIGLSVEAVGDRDPGGLGANRKERACPLRVSHFAFDVWVILE
jgi:hypothetical protein